MVRSLGRSHAINMLGKQIEVVSAIVQRKPAALRYDAGAEAHVVGVDERTGVALSIRAAEVDCITGGKGSHVSAGQVADRSVADEIHSGGDEGIAQQ